MSDPKHGVLRVSAKNTLVKVFVDTSMKATYEM